MQTRDHKKLAEMFASEMSRKRIPYICKKAFIYGNIEPDKNPFTYLHGMLKVNSNPRIPFVTQESPFVNESPVL